MPSPSEVSVPAVLATDDAGDIVHAVCTCQEDAEPQLALCGTDTTGVAEGFRRGDQPCVVCLDALVEMSDCPYCGAGR